MILLDRDGVLNEDRSDYVKSPDELILVPGAASAVARLNQAGVLTVVVTNQGAIGRGLFDLDMLALIHQKLHAELAREGAHIDEILFCPDHPDHPTERRKPAPGMLLEALSRHGGVAEETPMIGDTLRDMQAAAAIGCPRMMVRTGHGENTLAAGLGDEVQPVLVFADLKAAIDSWLGEPG